MKRVFRVDLTPTPQVSEPIGALKRFLKNALRAYGLRCTRVEELKPEAATEQKTEMKRTD